MEKEVLSDEAYLDSLLKNLSKNEEADENTEIEEQKELSDEEIEAAADESLNQLLQMGSQDTDFDDISIEQLLNQGQGITAEEAEAEAIEAKQENTMDEPEPEEASMDEFNLGFDLNLDEQMEHSDIETEPEEVDLGLDFNIGMEESAAEETDVGLDGALGMEDSGDELLDSLSSIVREIHEDNGVTDEALAGTEEKKRKPAKKKAEKVKKVKTKENKLLKKLQNTFFRVEVVDLEEEAEQEKKLKLQKEEQKKAKAAQKEEQKKQKQEDKKAADAKKRELAQAKKQEKEKKLQEKKAKKAEQEAALGTEERIKLKPAFLAFATTVIAAMAISVLVVSSKFSYVNNINAAQKSLSVKNYEEAYQVLAGMELKKEDEPLYQKIELLVRLDKQYDSYVNFKKMNKPREALNALIQGMTIYYANTEQAKELGIETGTEELKETLMYSLVNDYGLNEEKVLEVCSMADANAYTKEIELYSTGQAQ